MHGLSVEPMIGPVVLRDYWLDVTKGYPVIKWVIVGGESGTRARPMPLNWAHDLLRQCDATKTAFFMKQLGGVQDKKDQLDDFPSSLKVREFP